MKIAVVRLSSLGDIILGMAALQLIRRHLPDCSITWVADRRFADILDHQPDLHQVIKLDLKRVKKQRSIRGAAQEYRALAAAGPFDAVIDLHGMIKSAITATMLGGKRYGFDRRVIKEPLSALFYQQCFAIPLELPAASRYAALAASSLGFPFRPEDQDTVQPFLFWGDEDNAATDRYFAPDRRTILFVPGTSAGYKNYPAERFAHLAELLGDNILACHGNDEELHTAERIAALVPNVQVLPRLTINQLKAAVGRCNLVIGGDTGPTHVAWGCGVPSITLFGATPVCIRPTPLNRIIATPTPVNLRRHDASDTSVRNIPEEGIAGMARELLRCDLPQ